MNLEECYLDLHTFFCQTAMQSDGDSDLLQIFQPIRGKGQLTDRPGGKEAWRPTHFS
jgi:hypothetical protein